MIALRGGCLCDPAQSLHGPADLYLQNGRVLAVVPPGQPGPTGAWRELDCRGLLVVPGVIDTLCRLRPAPEAWREDATAVAALAASAGYTGLVVYTGSADPAVIAALAAARLPVRLLPVAALGGPAGLADLGRLAAAGAVAFSDWPQATADTLRLRRALTWVAGLGRPVVVHPEDPALADGGVMHEGALSFALGLRGVPAVAEKAAVGQASALQSAFGGRLHFAALSAAGSLPLLGEATAGVSAHHLALTEEAVRGYRTAAKLSPPLRGAADREALLAAARAGRLCLASGHDPVPPEEKECEYDYASFGGPALRTTVAVALEALGPEAFVRAACSLPAQAFGLPAGTLRAGMGADVTVLDPAEAWDVPPGEGPLAGRRLRGRAVLTLSRGAVSWADPRRWAGDLDACINMQ